jgi:hypothetical protein
MFSAIAVASAVLLTLDPSNPYSAFVLHLPAQLE